MGAPKWTAEEEAARKAGIAKHGAGKWRTILKDPEFSCVLRYRSNVNLKDKGGGGRGLGGRQDELGANQSYARAAAHMAVVGAASRGDLTVFTNDCGGAIDASAVTKVNASMFSRMWARSFPAACVDDEDSDYCMGTRKHR